MVYELHYHATDAPHEHTCRTYRTPCAALCAVSRLLRYAQRDVHFVVWPVCYDDMGTCHIYDALISG